MSVHPLSSVPFEDTHPGAYLQRRFLEPLGISAAAFARGTGMSRSRVSEVIHGKRAISADTATRIAVYLGMEPAFWMALQAIYDLARVDDPRGEVSPADTRGFLVGPSGARRIEPVIAPRSAALRVSSDLMKRLRQKADATPRTAPREPVATEYPGGTRAVVSRRSSKE